MALTRAPLEAVEDTLDRIEALSALLVGFTVVSAVVVVVVDGELVGAAGTSVGKLSDTALRDVVMVGLDVLVATAEVGAGAMERPTDVVDRLVDVTKTTLGTEIVVEGVDDTVVASVFEKLEGVT